MTLKTEEVMVNIGPQHPSTHGVFRMRVTFDGEVVTDLEPVFGYLHRGTEKLAEERTYTQIITLTDRLDYLASMSNNLAYVLAAEKLAGIEPPEKGHVYPGHHGRAHAYSEPLHGPRFLHQRPRRSSDTLDVHVPGTGKDPRPL